MRGIIDGAAKADANSSDARAWDARAVQEFRYCCHDLAANALWPGRHVHRSPPQSLKRAVAAANTDLEFGAADFDSEIHTPPLQRNAPVQIVHDPVKRRQMDR